MPGAALPPLRVTFLGTAAASISPRATTSSLLLSCDDHDMLIDCGIGSLRQLRRAGHDPRQLEGVLLTHWHHDHTSGLPRLLRAARPRESGPTLPVYGPRPPRGVLPALRLSLPRLELDVRAVTAGFELALGGAGLRALRTEHKIASLGWELVDDTGTRTRRVVISGDTRPTAVIEAAAAGADLLIHEATFLEEHARWAHRDGHSTAAQAAALARRAGAGALALTHVPGRYPRKAVLAEGRAEFASAMLPDDLDVLTVLAAPPERRTSPGGWANLQVQHHGLRG